MALPSGTLLRAKDVVWQRIAGSAEPDDILRPPSAAGTPNLDLDQQARAAVYGAALRTSVTAAIRSVAAALSSRAIGTFCRSCCPPGLERSRSRSPWAGPVPAFCIPATASTSS
jgi:hypothetical protein